MPLNNGHRRMIEATIQHLLNFPSTESELCTEIQKIIQAIHEPVTQNHDYENFSRVFHNPTLILRLHGYGPLTIGDARRGLLEVVNTKLAECIKTMYPELGDEAIQVKLHDKPLGWNYNALLDATTDIPDNLENLITQPLGARDWQWDLQNPQQIQEALATANVQALTMSGLLTQPIAEWHQMRAFAESLLLQGVGPRLTTQQSVYLSTEHIYAMIRIPDITFEEAISLNIHQVEGILLGLSREQVRVPEFSFHSMHGINTLMERNPSLSLDDAYAQVQGLGIHQVEGILLGLSREQVQVPNFSFHSMSGINTLMERPPGLSLDDAYAQVQGLGIYQGDGILLGLSREQVLVPNFSFHSMNGINTLRERTPGLSLDDAYAQVQGLGIYQVEFILLGL